MGEVYERTAETEREIPAWAEGKARRISSLIEGRVVLDVGCGTGNLTQIYRRDSSRIVVGIDTDQDAILAAKSKGRGFFKRDFFDETGRYDTIIMADVLEHMEHPQSAISKAYRLLWPKGTLILALPAFYFLYSDYDRKIGHHQRWELEGITRMLHQDGFRVKHFEYYDFIGFWAWLINCRLNGKDTSGLKGPIQNAIIRIQNLIVPPIGSTLIIKAESLRRST